MLGWKPERPDDRPLRILCLGAHSDDIEIGCGAALLHLIEHFQPLEIGWTVFSGSRSRAAEAAGSAGYWLQDVPERSVQMHDFRDGFFPDDWAAIKAAFEQLKGSFLPDLIFTHWRGDAHQDHRIIGELTWNTFRNHSILEYEIPKYDGDMGAPNFFIPVSEQAALAKAAALQKFFGSQRTRHWFSEELFLGLMRIRGMESCSPSGYAEAFYSRKMCLGSVAPPDSAR